jgi:hypothetical protein
VGHCGSGWRSSANALFPALCTVSLSAEGGILRISTLFSVGLDASDFDRGTTIALQSDCIGDG